jgi:NTE family protein
MAVAASSAFPPFLSPMRLALNASLWGPPSGAPSEDCHLEPYLSSAVLTDGGVYDNLGLETVWKRYRTVLISDGGAPYPRQQRPRRNWVSHLVRVLNTIDRQVRSLRKREVIAAFAACEREGTYWGISTSIADYGLPNVLPCSIEETSKLAAVSTRLKYLDAPMQDRLINWGYAVCDAAMRRWVDMSLPEPAGFPYPASGVGVAHRPPCETAG